MIKLFKLLSFVLLLNGMYAYGMENKTKDTRLLLELPTDTLGTIVKYANKKDDFFNTIKMLIRFSWVCKKLESLNRLDVIKTTLNLDQKTLDFNLHKYSRDNIIPFFELLIKMGAKVDTYYPTITLCIESGTHDYFAQHLISQGADVNRQNYLKMTPLHMAIQFNKINVIELLLKNKANMYLTNKYDYTPAYTAMLANKPECLKTLIEHGLDNSIEYTFDTIFKRTIAEWSKLQAEHHNTAIYYEIYTLVTGEELPRSYYSNVLLDNLCVIS